MKNESNAGVIIIMAEKKTVKMKKIKSNAGVIIITQKKNMQKESNEGVLIIKRRKITHSLFALLCP